MLINIKPTQEKILRALALYKFLTTSQMLRLKVASHQPNISANINPLIKRKYVANANFAITKRIDSRIRNERVESFYFLTTKGKKLLVQDFEMDENTIKYPKGTSTLVTRKHQHRKYAIDCEIEARLSAQERGMQVVQFDRDFDKSGSNRKGGNLEAKTKLELDQNFIIPDGNIILYDGNHKLFCFELHHKRSTKVIIEQLTNHTHFVEGGSMGVKYGFQKLHRVLNVFVDEAKMKAVLERTNNQPAFDEMEDFFFFKTLLDVKEEKDFYSHWLSLSGNSIELL